MEEQNINGVIPDPRSPLDKGKDYNQDEVVPTAIVLNWNRDRSGEPVYSVRDQDGSYSCVGQAIAKALEIVTGLVQSAHPIYRRRANYPDKGMWLQNAFEIVRKQGTTTEALDISQGIDETQMNRDITVATPVTLPLYVTIYPITIDAIATAIETQKQCPITIQSNYSEWDVEKPVLNGSPITFGHAITGVYYFTDENGKKCITVDESWGLTHIRRRVLTEDFLKSRITGAGYWVKPVAPTPFPKPHFRFSGTLTQGQANYSIRTLQDILNYEGITPIVNPAPGVYGPVTAKRVLAWQIKHNVSPVATLSSLGGKWFGPKSIAVANKIYA